MAQPFVTLPSSFDPGVCNEVRNGKYAKNAFEYRIHIYLLLGARVFLFITGLNAGDSSATTSSPYSSELVADLPVVLSSAEAGIAASFPSTSASLPPPPFSRSSPPLAVFWSLACTYVRLRVYLRRNSTTNGDQGKRRSRK